MFRKSDVNKTTLILLVLLKYREIITVKTVILYLKNKYFIKTVNTLITSLKSKKKKLALTLFYYVSREIWLGNSKSLYA